MPITDKQLAAKRANALKSTGPRTPEGKARSSQNARTHGCSADGAMVLLDCEDPAQFDAFLVKLRGIHKPATPAEEDVFEEMAVARWRLRRMRTVELSLLNSELLAQQSKSDTSKPGAHLGTAFRALADDSRSLALASRYESRLQRVYERAYKTLRELQQARQPEPTEPATITVRWVDPPKEPDDEPELRNEATGATNKEVSAPPRSHRTHREASSHVPKARFPPGTLD